jgi:hypothetical protein
MMNDDFLEECSALLFKVACNKYLKDEGKEHWTKGDYSLLEEPQKQDAREAVKKLFRAVIDDIVRYLN